MNAWSIALDSIWHHKLRSALTALGIVIGVFAVVTLTSLGHSFKQYIGNQFNTLGATLITVMPAPPHAKQATGGASHAGFGAAPSTLTLGDVAAIAAQGGNDVASVAPVAPAAALITYGGKTASTGSVLGTTSAYFGILSLHFAAGGTAGFASGGAVLGHAVAQELFGGSSAVGHTVLVGGKPYTVTGVLQTTGAALSGDADDTTYIPVGAALALSGSSKLAEIVAAAAGTADVPAAAAAITRLLDQRHTLRDFAVVTAGQILATINKTLSVVTSVLGGIAAISLLVGGIGIMNIMLVTVTERVREIGTRKALGARDGDILVQFLVEAVLLSLLGGAVGTGFSALAGRVVGQIIHFPISLTATSVGVALGFSLLVGVVFGVLPALNAARLMPAEALRSE
jgi:putative ABC transport system permease protein